MDRSCRLLHGQTRRPFEWNYFPLLTGRIVLSNKKRNFNAFSKKKVFGGPKLIWYFVLAKLCCNVCCLDDSCWLLMLKNCCLSETTVFTKFLLSSWSNVSSSSVSNNSAYLKRFITISSYLFCTFRIIFGKQSVATLFQITGIKQYKMKIMFSFWNIRTNV